MKHERLTQYKNAMHVKICVRAACGKRNPALENKNVVVAAHYVPGCWCLTAVDLDLHLCWYYDSIGAFDYADAAMDLMKTHVDLLLEQAGVSDVDVASFEVAKFGWPRQPGGVSCGICVFGRLELLLREGLHSRKDWESICS